MPETLTRLERLPPRRLPLLYFGVAHLSLATAAAMIAVAPRSVLGFYYHPRLIFVVHLVTLGWITSSILGALHLVGPMALRTPMPAKKADYWTFGLYVFGASGIVFHFLVEEWSGLGLSGLFVLYCAGQVAWKTLRPLCAGTSVPLGGSRGGTSVPLGGSRGGTSVPGAVKLHFVLAFGNFGLAALWGSLLAFHKFSPFLPGYVLSHVHAHAHLAALGWATLMVFASAYRLLPMFLPSAMPGGFSLYLTGGLFEVGVLGVFASLLLKSSWLDAFAVLAAAGVAGFFAHLVWMKRNPRPAARGLLRPDLGVAQAMLAFAYLAASTGLGVYLAFTPATETTLRLVLVYGVAGLVGFLAQMVVGISNRLLPIFSWLGTFADLETEGPEVRTPDKTPHQLPDRRLQAATFVLWTLAVPALMAGFYADRAELASLGGWLLLLAVACGAASHAVLFREWWGAQPRPPDDVDQIVP